MSPIPNIIEIIVRTTNDTASGFEDARNKARGAGTEVGDEFTKGVGDKVKADLPAKVDQPLTDAGKKAGQDAGNAAAGGISPLIVGAFAAAAAIGPAALLAGTATAVGGAAALVLKSNQVIAADYTKLGQDVSLTLKNAVAPITGDMHVALGQLDSDIVGLQPKLQGLFAAVGPDLSAVVSGVSSFVGQMLPGLNQALAGSQGIVADFAQSLGPLGSGVGSFFTGIVRDASVEGAALRQVVGTIGNAFSTLGTVMGSASADASAALMAITPVLNGLLSTVRAVADPTTVGAVAGLFGAMKLDPMISSGLTKASDGLGSIAQKISGGEGIAGKFSALGGAAEGASGVLGKMAGVVGGPWGLAIGAGIGLATSLAASLMQASHATDAVKVSTDQLTQAVAQDGGKVGEATTAYLAQQDSLNGLYDTASKAGVSLDTLAQAASGNQDALNSLKGGLDNAEESTLEATTSNQKMINSFNGSLPVLNQVKIAQVSNAAETNNLTTANQKLLNSVVAQAQQTADAINKQTLLTQATNALNNSTSIFNATMGSDYQALVQKTQQTADATVASLNLGIAQSTLNQTLAGSLTSYQLAQSGASAYKTILDETSGAANTLFGSQTSLDSAMLALTDSFKTNGFTIADNTKAGIANRQAIENVAKTAQDAAAALYQSEVSTKGASQAYTDANGVLAKSKQAFIDDAIAAHGNKDEVQQLADALFHLPPSVSTTIGVNTAPAYQGVNELLNYINSSGAVVHIFENVVGQIVNTGMSTRAQAHGGVTGAASGMVRSGLTLVGEAGPELVNLPPGGTVHSNVDTQRILAEQPRHSPGGTMTVKFAGDTDSAFAAAFMLMIRQGKITIKQAAVVP